MTNPCGDKQRGGGEWKISWGAQPFRMHKKQAGGDAPLPPPPPPSTDVFYLATVLKGKLLIGKQPGD